VFLPKVITFSGLDGSGKTTVINSLKKKLEGKGLVVKTPTMYDDLSFYAILRSVRDGIRKFFGKNIELSKEMELDPNFDLHSESLVYKVIRYKWLKAAVLPLDTLSIYLFLILKVKRNDVVLLDRTSYDYILDILPKKYKKLHLSIALFFSFRPSLSVFIDTPAQVSFDRKGEHTVEYLQWRSVVYTQIFNIIDGQIVIDNYNNSVEHNVGILLEQVK
jgi:thymidylate kinase